MNRTEPPQPRFLTAEWRHLAMVNHVVPEHLLEPLVPAGVELDLWQGRALVSLVGFRFLRTRVLGVPVPWHRHFEEVNLRFYVRRRMPDGWRRGVVFVRELVPRRAIAAVARVWYDEPYLAVPMYHSIEPDPAAPGLVVYGWRHAGVDGHLRVSPTGGWRPLRAGEEAEFITEHYWGYTKRRDGSTSEYEVAHPPWRVMEVAESSFEADVAALYGPAFAPYLTAPPASSLLAEGSAVTVHRGRRLPR